MGMKGGGGTIGGEDVSRMGEAELGETGMGVMSTADALVVGESTGVDNQERKFFISSLLLYWPKLSRRCSKLMVLANNFRNL